MARRPEILRGFVQLASAINGPGSTIEPQLRNLISQMTSRAAGCGYCMARTAHTAGRVGISEAKEEELWEYETSPLFSAAERAAHVPNAVTDEDFNELKRHYTDTQIVDIVAVIALFGFLNRFNDTMATELEASPIEAGQRFLAQKGWTVGKHAG
jgi:alkylhydroperoxidase family enzyme